VLVCSGFINASGLHNVLCSYKNTILLLKENTLIEKQFFVLEKIFVLFSKYKIILLLKKSFFEKVFSTTKIKGF